MTVRQEKEILIDTSIVKDGLCFIVLKYKATKRSAQPKDPPGCPLCTACTILTISRLTCEAVSCNVGINVTRFLVSGKGKRIKGV